MSITERLVDFVVNTRYERLPPHIVKLAQCAFLDSLGTALAGSREQCGRIAADTVRAFEGGSLSTVVGGGFKSSPPFAALANGTAGHALDYDDASVNIHGHASVAIVPAALALAEPYGATGKELITAYAVAYEVGQRVSNAINPQHYGLGWHTTSTIGSLRAVASASRILRLDGEKTRKAFGIAASMACGLNQNFGTMTKPLHAGLAAKNGVIAAQLAARGYTADSNILEADHGFCQVFCAGQPYQAGLITANLGEPFCLEEPGIVFKPYPCCRASHPVIDAVLSLRAAHNLRPEDVERIRCGVSYMRVRIMRYSDPQTVDQSRFSMEFDTAIAMMDGRAGLRQFSMDRLHDPAVRNMMKRVEMYVHPTMKDRLSQSVDVEIILRGGKVLHQWVETPLGSPGNPIPDAQMLDKFRECAEGTLRPANVEKAIGILTTLPEQSTIADLMAVLAGACGNTARL